MNEKGPTPFDPQDVYAHAELFGEQPGYDVPVETDFRSKDLLHSDEEVIPELESGEVGIFTRAQQAAGNAVAVAWGGADRIKTYVAKHHEVIIGVSAAGVGLTAGAVLLHKLHQRHKK